MNLPLFIAGRYLFAKKSHNVINLISAISAVGMAVGTAALIIILSVYNGFDALVKSMLSSVEPDLAVVAEEGKFFVPGGEAYDWLYDCPQVKNVCTVLQDNVFASYESKQGTVLCKGVDMVYEDESPLQDYIVDGQWSLRRGELNLAAVGRTFADRMGIRCNFQRPLTLYYPSRGATVSAVNPMGSVGSEKLWPSCLFAVNADVDGRMIVVSREVMCSLLGCTDEVSAVEIRLTEGCGPSDVRRIRRAVQQRLPEGFKVLDRAGQNPQLYKMLRQEKTIIYLIMVFIVLILGFSIFGALSMLMIDKSADIATLRAMGASRPLVRRIFTLEGWMITLVGLAVGMVVGVVFCLLQQHFGFVKMPGSYIVDAYPVILQWGDVVAATVGTALIGYLVALIPARRI